MVLKKYTTEQIRRDWAKDGIKGLNIEFVRVDELKPLKELLNNMLFEIEIFNSENYDIYKKEIDSFFGRADENQQTNRQHPNLGDSAASLVSFVPNTEGGELQECKSNTTPAKASPQGVVIPKESSPSSVSCLKCNKKGYYMYDNDHIKPCEECCNHNIGSWKLEEHYGKDNGKYCCLKGCGYVQKEKF